MLPLSVWCRTSLVMALAYLRSVHASEDDADYLGKLSKGRLAALHPEVAVVLPADRAERADGLIALPPDRRRCDHPVAGEVLTLLGREAVGGVTVYLYEPERCQVGVARRGQADPAESLASPRRSQM